MGEYKENRTGFIIILDILFIGLVQTVQVMYPCRSIWPQAKPLLMKKDIEQLVDPSLGVVYNREELIRLTSTATLCIEQSSLLRPRMSQVQYKPSSSLGLKVVKNRVSNSFRPTFGSGS